MEPPDEPKEARSQSIHKLAATIKRAQASRRQWRNPQRRQAHQAIMQDYWQQAAFREHMQQRRWDSSHRRQQSERLKAHWQDPLFRNRMRRGQISAWTPERRRKHSEAMRRYWAARHTQKQEEGAEL